MEEASFFPFTRFFARALVTIEGFRAEVFEKEEVKIIGTMVPTPFGCLEVEEEVFGPDAAQFGKAPEALNAIDMIFAAGELVLRMVDAVMLGAAQDEAVTGLPAVGVDDDSADLAALAAGSLQSFADQRAAHAFADGPAQQAAAAAIEYGGQISPSVSSGDIA